MSVFVSLSFTSEVPSASIRLAKIQIQTSLILFLKKNVKNKKQLCFLPTIFAMSASRLFSAYTQGRDPVM